MLCTGLLLSSEQQRIDVLGCDQPLEELALVCAAVQPAALVIAVQGSVSATLARQLRALQMDVACPLALVGADLAGSQSILQGIPLRLLDEQGDDLAGVLSALLAGRLEL